MVRRNGDCAGTDSESGDFMKRYRVLQLDFDFTANWLDLDIDESWDEDVKQLHRQNREKIVEELIHMYGDWGIEQTIENLRTIGAQPFSVIGFHNEYYQQAREAFVFGCYYPALTAVVVLGERILNQLTLALRDMHHGQIKHRPILKNKSFDNWHIMIETLVGWGVLLPDVADAFRRLEKLRNNTVHFREFSLEQFKDMAIVGIKDMNLIIHRQFGILGGQPWFIAGIKGASFIKKSYESDPFVQRFLLPHSRLVGPKHRLWREESTGLWNLEDDQYEDREISDDEFRALVEAR
jgi:hypothetical protein